MFKKNIKFKFRFGHGVILLLLNSALNLQAMDDALVAELHGITKGYDSDADSGESSSSGDRVSVGSYSTDTRTALALADKTIEELTMRHLFAKSIGESTADLDSVVVRIGEGDALRESTKSAPPAVSPVSRPASAELVALTSNSTLDDGVIADYTVARVVLHDKLTDLEDTVSVFRAVCVQQVTTQAGQSAKLIARILATKDRGLAFVRPQDYWPKFDYVGSADGSGSKDRS